MPVYTVEDTATGKRYKVEGDRPPTEADLQSLFQNAGQPTKDDSMLDNALDVAGEFAAGANRTAVSIPDIIPNLVNAISGFVGSDVRAPTLRGALEGTGIEGGFMEEGTARDVVRGAGQALPAAGAFPQVARNVATVPGAVAEFAGIGSASPASQLPAVSEMPEKVARDLALKRRSGDTVAAGYRLGPNGPVKDSAQQGALKAGLDEGIVAQVASGSPQDKARMGQMLDIVEQGRKNKTFADFNSPRQALGETLMDRYQWVQNVNREAGKKVKEASNALKGKKVDFAQPVDNFLARLAEEGVEFNPAEGVIKFGRSSIRGVPKAQKDIADIIKYMYNTRNGADAHDLHMFKRVLDERLYHGTQPDGGLSKRMAGILRQLRGEMDEVLDTNFPDYNEANTVFAETKEALSNVEDLLGKKNTVGTEQLGRIARRAVSNAQSAERARDMLTQLDELGRKYGGDFSDDPERLTSFVQSLEKMFNVSPPASFKGDISKAVDQAVEAGRVAAGDNTGVLGMAGKAANKVFGKSQQQQEEALIKQLRALLAQ